MPLSGKWLLLLPLLSFWNLLFAQEISPYSRFGLGVPSASTFSAQKGMGRIVSGYRDPLHINFNNPASYSNLALTTLESGFKFSSKKITDGQTDQSFRAGDGFLDYLALGFPGKKAGISVGMVPYSDMNYNFQSDGSYDTLSALRLFEGTGRTYQLYIGGGYRYPKNDTSNNTFSLGLNVSYVFGRLNRSNILSFQEPGYYNSRVISEARLNNLALNPGIQYRRKINDSLNVVIGAYGLFPVAVNSSEYQRWDKYVIVSGSVILDTLYENKQDNESIKIPVDIGFGATISNRNKWMAGFDVKFSRWKDLELFFNDATLKNSIEFNAGGEYRPSLVSQSLFKATTYRLGFFYNNGSLELDNERIGEYGFTFGMDFPIKTMFSRLNFSFEVGNKGTTKNGLISETSFKAYIGLTLNDKWFIKPKYD